MKPTLVFFCLWLAVALAWPLTAGASRPVPRTIQGCVINGILYSVRKDLVSERTGKRTVAVYPIRVVDFDVTPFEGKKIRLRGSLSPGDRFTPDPQTLEVLGPCDKKSKAAILQEDR
jgi:hypothetical protein